MSCICDFNLPSSDTNKTKQRKPGILAMVEIQLGRPHPVLDVSVVFFKYSFFSEKERERYV